MIYVGAEAIVAADWDRRRYSYVDDYVNFLGSPYAGEFRDYTISSPLWWLMSIAWILTGALIAASVITLSRRLTGWRRTTITALGVIGLVNIPATYGWVPTGIAERTSLYSYLLWALTTGIALLRTGPDHATADHTRVD